MQASANSEAAGMMDSCRWETEIEDFAILCICVCDDQMGWNG